MTTEVVACEDGWFWHCTCGEESPGKPYVREAFAVDAAGEHEDQCVSVQDVVEAQIRRNYGYDAVSEL